MKKLLILLIILAIIGLLGYTVFLKFQNNNIEINEVVDDVKKVTNEVIKTKNSNAWSFAVVGDHEGVGSVAKKIVEDINSDEDIELLVNVGDLVATGEVEEFEEF